MWDITFPRKVISGTEALEYLSFQRFQHVFIVTDPIMKKLHLQKVMEQLKKSKISVFDEISDEPSLDIVRRGSSVLANLQPSPDALIALGGGSVMDAAKGMRAMWADPEEDIESLNPFKKLDLQKKTDCIMISIPTTSGTGADVTWSVVLTDTSDEVPRKHSVANRDLVPDISILDPIFTESMPIELMIGTALDALCHSIDAYLSTYRNDFSDAVARHAFKLLWENIQTAFDQAKISGNANAEVREKIHNAATMAGMAQSNSQIILSHCLAHSVGAVFNIPHSVCIGAMCWYSLSFNKETELHRIANLARIARLDGSSDSELSTQFIDIFKDRLIKFNMPISLKEMKISKEQYESKSKSLITYAENDSGMLSNPRDATYDDFAKIFNYLYDGIEIDF
ncbi:MAG: iron-containing alcohol dehydrogenase [Candidatus Hodarchaeales archaeon]|jgi:alcohol dehydrogenase class IV